MRTADIRTKFLAFYESEGHLHLPSASLVPSSYDPSVLLTIAGMQPFKPYFLGQEEPPRSRATTSQKCFRTPDIEEVGLTERHLTFFEMLGNFSFGDYFKPEAIAWAWRLITEVFAVDVAKLWVTVHEGDSELGLGIDQEAVDLWLGQGVAPDRIVALGEDNFWKAGPTGPCGPCSEIYYDRGAEHGCGAADCKPGCECDRFMEFYNLVFMQYQRDAHGALSELPNRNIDTGMGLERITAILQGGVPVFDTDAFTPLIRWAEQRSGKIYDSDQPTTKAMRVLADHGRGMCFLASDGVTPSNEGRGYVLRRVIRRAIQHAERLGMYANGGGATVLADLQAVVVEGWGDVYPELIQQRDAVREILVAEEERFLRTLANGSGMLREIVAAAKTAGHSEVSGADAFQLHDTYGFPVELTAEVASEAGLSVDRGGFDELMLAQRERARAAGGGSGISADVAAKFVRTAEPTVFTGYTLLSETTLVTAIQPMAAGEDGAGSQLALLKLAESPFYAEGGGQVSDQGDVVGPKGRLQVLGVLRFETDQVIWGELDGELTVGDEVRVEVPAARRNAIQANHTATHLLQRALRDRLGDHVRQAGSLVTPDRLRFDFMHPKALTPAELGDVEAAVKAMVEAGDPVRWSEMPIDEARERGAMMLFGEKYGDIVRLVEVGDGESRELCGGTHVHNTAQIRLFLITHEASVGTGTRRIEALTGAGAEAHLRHLALTAADAAKAANVEPDRLVSRVEELRDRARLLERELTQLRSGSGVDAALATGEQLGDVTIVVYRDDALSGDELLAMADSLRDRAAPSVVLLGSAHEGKVSLIATASEEALGAGANAGNLIRAVAPIVGGGGGGRPNLARAGGKDPAQLDAALDAGRAHLRELLAGSPTAS